MNKPNWLKNAIAKEDGFYTIKGEKLKNQKLTAEFIQEWNNTDVPNPKEIKVVFDDSTVTGISITEVNKDESIDLNSMTKKELVAYAKELDIEINPRSKKDDILNSIALYL